jgi:N-acylneuraminate cytidylyltransferase
MKADTIAIIPARGGSKRIPGKNLRPFLGRPIIDYPIRACLDSELFARVVVSTDSEAIALHAFEQGATSMQRPEELCSDESPVVNTVLHVLEVRSKHRMAWPIEYVCVVFPTSVFATPDALRIGKWAMRDRSGCVSIIPLGVPVERCLRLNKQTEKLQMINPQHQFSTEQSLGECYRDAAQFYWIQVSAFMKNPVLFPEDMTTCIYPKYSVVDINDDDDWRQAEKMCRGKI